MNTLDRYIARQYFFNVLTLTVLLASFVVAVDVALNLDRFVRVAEKLDPSTAGSAVRKVVVTALLVADLWWPRLLQLFNFLVGLVLVAGMGFTFTQLVRHRELVAVLASGISLYRVARPVFLVAAALLGLQVLNQELIIPRIAPLLVRDHGDAGKRSWGRFDVRLARDAEGRVMLARAFDPSTGQIEGFEVWERDQTGSALRRVTAPSARWDGSGWVLTSGRAVPLRAIPPDDPAGGPALPPPEEPVVRLETDLSPTVLLARHHASFSQSLSWGQIRRLAESRAQDAELQQRLERVQYGRISTILSNLLTMAITMPFFLLREPRSMVVQALKCAPVGMAALIGGVLGASATIPGLPAAVGVFVPVILLVPVAIASLSLMRT